MTREEIIKEFKKADISCDEHNDIDYIDDNFSRVLDLVEKLVSKNESLHLVSACYRCGYDEAILICDNCKQELEQEENNEC